MPPAAKPTNDAARVESLREYAILDTQSEQEYDDITALASYICGTPAALVSFVDEDRQWFKAGIGLDAKQTSRDESFCAHALTMPDVLVVEDTQLDPRFAGNAFVLGDPHIRFYAGAPIRTPDGHGLGTVCVLDTVPRTLTTHQLAALKALSRQVMALLEARQRVATNERAAAVLMQSEKLAAVGRIASSMAHAINNPLEAITNLLYLSRAKNTDAEVGGWIDLAELELRRVSVIANQTLRFHKQSTRPQPITCLDLFTATLDLYESRLRNAEIMVEKRKRAKEPINCFEGDIRQVLSNVVNNAIDAMPNGGRLLVRSRESIDWRSAQRGITLTLADTGSGMLPEVQRRMFEAFYTTKGIGGSGLGLWISADIMHRHGGHITIRSSCGSHHGTVVCLFLPFEGTKSTTGAA